jgi:hypothetical protein
VLKVEELHKERVRRRQLQADVGLVDLEDQHHLVVL